MQDGILSIQSAVAYGHVGNSAAVFPLQRLGFEVWPVNTVLFSNHTGYGAWRGRIVPLEWVEEIIAGLADRGAIPRTRAVLSGYLGDANLGEAVLRTVARVRGERPDMVYACDPVMGDEGRGFFVKAGIPEFFRDHAMPVADIVTPNQFELAWLAGGPVEDLNDAMDAAAAVRAKGPKIVVCTSLALDDPAELGILAHSAEASWLCRTPRLPVTLNGTGDAFTALFLGSWLKTGDVARTLEHAVAAMFALVEATHRAGSRELELVLAQDSLVAPARPFPAVRVT
jgi:pyridoxine kinase